MSALNVSLKFVADCTSVVTLMVVLFCLIFFDGKTFVVAPLGFNHKYLRYPGLSRPHVCSCLSSDSLPKVVKRRINALKNLQVKCAQIEAKFYEEVHELERKYAALYQPLFDKVRPRPPRPDPSPTFSCSNVLKLNSCLSCCRGVTF